MAGKRTANFRRVIDDDARREMSDIFFRCRDDADDVYDAIMRRHHIPTLQNRNGLHY